MNLVEIILNVVDNHQVQFIYLLNPTPNSQLEVHIGTHAACHSESSCYCRQCGHNQLKYQLPSIRFISCTHNRKFLKLIIFLDGRGWKVEGGEMNCLASTSPPASVGRLCAASLIF